MKTQIRPACESDIPALIALSRRTIDARYRGFLGDDAVDGFIDSGAADEYVRNNILQCSVILTDGTVVGYSLAREDVIDLIMIDARVHGAGLGTKLIEHIEQELFRQYGELKLESFEANDQANRFYRKRGWRESERYPDKQTGAMKIMFRKLRPPVKTEN
jgi:ribosomal protein S18 acetylase RimI-like enzyme